MTNKKPVILCCVSHAVCSGAVVGAPFYCVYYLLIDFLAFSFFPSPPRAVRAARCWGRCVPALWKLQCAPKRAHLFGASGAAKP